MKGLQIELPENFFEEEIRCGYTISSEMKKVWAVQLDLLYTFDQVCKKNNITYFASGGTMLGAIRHKGYIPWDDDIDVMMMRDQYQKLCKIATTEFQKPYFFQTEYTDKGSLRGHAQLRNSNTTGILKNELKKMYSFNQGIFIDIFPLDAVIDNKKLFYYQSKKALKYKKMAFRISNLTYRYDISETKGIKKAMKALAHQLLKLDFLNILTEERMYRKFETECQKYNDKNTEYISTLSLDFTNKNFFKCRKDFEKTVLFDFEVMQIPVSKEYDHALKQRYGNYMEFKQDKSLHGDIIFDTQKSYLDYLKSIKADK